MTPLFVFDAYGTLFDVHSAVARHAAEIGPQAERLSELWRVKQLEYCWVRSLAGAYRDFAELTRDALFYAAARCGGLNPALLGRLIVIPYLPLSPEVMKNIIRLQLNRIASRVGERQGVARDKLRGTMDASEYKHVVLGLLFLKYISDAFEERRAQLVADGDADAVEDRDEYTAENVFWVPPTAR